MTENEEKQVFTLVRSLLPRTTPELAMELVDRVKKSPVAAIFQAVRNHAATEPEGRLSIHWVTCEIDRIVFNVTPEQKIDAARAEFLLHREAEKTAKQRADAELSAARAFCLGHREELEEWVKQAIAECPWLQKSYEKRGVIDSPTLICLIFKRHGGLAVAQ